MSDASPIPLDQPTLALLADLEPVLQTSGLRWYLIGAIARDLLLPETLQANDYRRTLDVDLAVWLPDEHAFHVLQDRLEATGAFRRDERNPIRLQHREGMQADLIPFGGLASEQGEVRLTKPMAFTIEFPGLQEMEAHIVTHQAGERVLYSCPAEGLLLLKLLSNDDRPERTQDLTDIELLLKGVFEVLVYEISTEHFDLYDKYDGTANPRYGQEIAGHFLGRKMRSLLLTNEPLKARILAILQRRDDATWSAVANGLKEDG
ncbi:MAG: hypothetical protein ACO1HP_05930 [Bacteroidota bacterium]